MEKKMTFKILTDSTTRPVWKMGSWTRCYNPRLDHSAGWSDLWNSRGKTNWPVKPYLKRWRREVNQLLVKLCRSVWGCLRRIWERKAGTPLLYVAFASLLSGTYQSSYGSGHSLLKDYPQAVIEILESRAASMGKGCNEGCRSTIRR